MQTHPRENCVPHTPVLTTFSSKVKIEGRGVGRKGDQYGGGHIIITGSGKVNVD